jgi:hypothetical protein
MSETMGMMPRLTLYDSCSDAAYHAYNAGVARKVRMYPRIMNTAISRRMARAVGDWYMT